MNHHQNIAVIVDAYGPAKHYVSYFKEKGLACLHVQSTEQPLPALTKFKEEDYIANIIHHGELSQTIASIQQIAQARRAKVACVIAGIEPGVILADTLSEKMNLITNGTAKSKARRDKYWMTEELRRNGIATVNYYKSNDVKDILTWIDGNLNWPVILKPLDSAGTNGVFVCQNQDEVRRSFSAIMGQVNNMGSTNQEVLVQSFLKGEEYIVNCVSLAGKHYVSDIWLTHKKFITGHSFIYDYEELLSFHGSIQKQLVQYVFLVLDALDIKFGASHTELKMTDAGPILIETGARISGALNPQANNISLQCNQIELAVDAYVDPILFKIKTATSYKLFKPHLHIFLTADREGIVTDLACFDLIRRLPSVHEINLKIKIGSRLKKTIDLSSSPGMIDLVHQDINIIKRDYKIIQHVFKTRLSYLRE